MDQRALAAMRQDYSSRPLHEADVLADPIAQFERWFEEAKLAVVDEPNAMALATVGADGQPSLRIVLLKAIDQQGLTFFTNLESRKAADLAACAKAALTFWWPPLHRQVRFEGTIGPVDAAEADSYFATRPAGSQIGAWSSPQSREIADRATLTAAVEATEARFAGQAVPRPPFWGGYRLTPLRIEFWQGQRSRLHDRLLYARQPEDAWRLARLAP